MGKWPLLFVLVMDLSICDGQMASVLYCHIVYDELSMIYGSVMGKWPLSFVVPYLPVCLNDDYEFMYGQMASAALLIFLSCRATCCVCPV